jgi:hypothetical protein
MKYFLTAAGVLLLVYLTGKCKYWLRLKWCALSFKQEKIFLVLRIRNLGQQIEGLVRELVTWRGYQAPYLELVIVDLDSKDESKAILERLYAKFQNFYLLSSQAYRLDGLNSLGFAISEVIVIDLDSGNDYLDNLHKLKRTLANIVPTKGKLGNQVMS